MLIIIFKTIINIDSALMNLEDAVDKFISF